jgi:hypothetical protein
MVLNSIEKEVIVMKVKISNPMPTLVNEPKANEAAKKVTSDQYAQHVQNCVPSATPYP